MLGPFSWLILPRCSGVRFDGRRDTTESMNSADHVALLCLHMKEELVTHAEGGFGASGRPR